MADQQVIPDFVVAVYGNGRCEARIRGTSEVVAEAPDPAALMTKLMPLYPAGYDVEFRYDPHM